MLDVDELDEESLELEEDDDFSELDDEDDDEDSDLPVLLAESRLSVR